LKSRPVEHLIRALLVFTLLGLEFPLLLFTRIFDGRPMEEALSWPVHWYGAVIHWSITLVLWIIGILLYRRWALARRGGVDLYRWDLDEKGLKVLLLAALAATVHGWIFSRLGGLAFPQVYRELLGFRSMYGGLAPVVSLFQNLYYVAEFALVTVIVAEFHRAGALWTGLPRFPWGGLGLVLTWGAVHFVSNPPGAAAVMTWALVVGTVYVAGDRRVYPVFAALLLGYLL